MLFALAAALPAPAYSAGVVERVVLLSIDGLRPDAITPHAAPNLAKLLKRAAYSLDAQTVAPSSTLPAHASMLTGLGVQRHGVSWNHYVPGRYQGETVFTLARRAGRTSAALYAKTKLRYLVDPQAVDFAYGPSWPLGAIGAFALVRRLERIWSRRAIDLAFVHVREPDDAGHAHGWMSPRYLRAVTRVDRAVGRLLALLEDSPVRTALIVTADHGGHGRGHGTTLPADMTIPWIALAPGRAHGRRIERPVRIYDTAPTVLALLGIESPAGLDGRVIPEALVTGSLEGAGTASAPLLSAAALWEHGQPPGDPRAR